MNKYLVAAAALAAMTGAARAEVALTGDARMGVVYDGNDFQFSERARVRFNLSGETDTGLEFGASFRAHEADGAAEGGAFGSSGDDKSGSVWISGSYGKLEMGDVDSAAEAAFGNLSGIGFSELGDPNDIPYINGDGADTLDQGPGALYSFATEQFEFHLGLTDGSGPAGAVEDLGTVGPGGEPLLEDFDREVAYSVAAAFSGDTYKVGAGYLDNGDAEENNGAYGGSQWIVYGAADLSGWSLQAYYSSYNDGALTLDKSYGLSVDHTFGNLEVTAFARRDEVFDPDLAGDDNLDHYGVGAVYDLGGGASILGGVAYTDEIADGETIADLGIDLAF